MSCLSAHPGPIGVPAALLSGPGKLLGPAPAQHRGRQGQVSGPPETQGLWLEASTRKEGERLRGPNSPGFPTALPQSKDGSVQKSSADGRALQGFAGCKNTEQQEDLSWAAHKTADS